MEVKRPTITFLTTTQSMRILKTTMTTIQRVWLDIAAGWYNKCGIHEDGSLECFGYTDTGIVNAPDGEYIAVSCGNDHCIALDTEGEAVSWG